MDVKRLRYVEMVLIDEFGEIDKRLLELVLKEIESYGKDSYKTNKGKAKVLIAFEEEMKRRIKSGKYNYIMTSHDTAKEVELSDPIKFRAKSHDKLLDMFEDKVRKRISVKYPYLATSGYIANMQYSLFQCYLILALVIKTKQTASAYEAIYNVVNDDGLRQNFSIYGWSERGWMMSREVRPSRLLLPIKYLTQLGYNGEIKNRKIYEKVRKDYEMFMKDYRKFRPLTEEEFNSKEMNTTDRL